MRIEDYTIEVGNKDWARLLSTWSWLLTGPFSVRLANRFGDLFLVRPDQSVELLDTGLGELRTLAPSVEEFLSRLGAGEAAEWLKTPLVDALVTAGQVPADGYCYSYQLPPVFGGEYEPSNILIRELDVHYRAFGPIHERIKDLPDGTEITFKLES